MKKHNLSSKKLIRITLELTIIILIISSTFNILTSIYINPGDSIQYQIDNPLETYTWSTPYNVSRITIASTYIVFNNTGFNITASNPINIEINSIDSDITNPLDGNDDLVAFTITNTPGATWFNLSGFEPTLSYTVKVNNVFLNNYIANNTGSISFQDNPNSNDEYIIYWTSGSNTPPTISNPSPADEATGIATSPTLSAIINDLDGNPMTYSIRTNESGLDWYTIKTDTNQPNGTISTTTTGNFTADYTKYWWSVNCTDGAGWTNTTYSFTTTGTGTPVVQTNPATNIQEINVTLNGELQNDGGENCTVWFEWDNTTALNETTTNQTANSGDSFTVSLMGNLTKWYDTDWVRRKQITINHAYITNDLKNYPVYLNITGDYSLAQTNGRDILFTQANGLDKLNHELVRFTDKNHIEAWVNISKVYAANDTVIWMYWGNPSASNQWNIGETWTDLYAGVYHLDEDTGSVAYDSSGNSYDATYYGDLPNRNISFDGYGQYLDGDGDYIKFSSSVYSLVHGNSAGYMSFVKQGDFRQMPYWITRSADTPSSKQRTKVYYDPVGGYGQGILWPTGAANSTSYNSWLGEYAFTFSPFTNWFMVLHKWNPSAAYLYGTTSGDLMTSDSVAEGIPSIDTYETFNFGYDPDTTVGAGQRYYKGYVDEIRIYQNNVNSSWIKTDNYNFKEQSGFITVGDTETRYYDTGILSPGRLYYYRAMANNTNYLVHGDTVRFLTRPTEPQLFAALTGNKSGIQLTWINGTGNNRTYIERSTDSTPWVRGDQQMIYNNSDTIFNDTNLELGTTYYYQAWSYTNWSDNNTVLNQYSRNYDYANNKTNTPPSFNTIFPTNNSITDVPLNLSIYIYDEDGDTFNWTIETEPDIGSSNHNNDVNGTKTCRINGTHMTTYTWYVNCTDGYDWTNHSYNFTFIIDHVHPPTNGNSKYNTILNRLNLSWTGTNRADTYVVVQRNDTYSSSATQTGNWIRQNNSNKYINISWSETNGGYFTIYSYNNTANMYSYNTTTPLGLNIPWGALALSCFNENNPNQAINFDIEISNSDFTDTYARTDLSNIHYIDMLDIPYGSNTIFLVSNSSYETRTYTYNIYQNAFYNLVFYLPVALPPGGSDDPGYDENETYSEDYVIHVVGPQTEYGVDPPIEDATVVIRKYINTTDQYETVGTYITSADGTFTVPLLPNNLYSFNISADGYYDVTESWMPVEIVFEGDRHHTFRLTPLSGEDVPGEDVFVFWDTITFTADMNDIDGLNGTLTITYNDLNSSTIDTQIYVYEYWNGSVTLMFTISNTSENSFSYTTDIINTTRRYKIVLYFNNTANFDTASPITIHVLPINSWGEFEKFDFEERTKKIFGPWGIGYATMISAFLAVMALVLFGPYNTGVGIITSGLVLGLTGALFSVLFTGEPNAALSILAPVIIVIGGLYVLVKNPGGHL